MNKYKSTGCARFIIFLLIFAPVAYFGARAISGEDVFKPLEDLFDKSEKTTTPIQNNNNTTDSELKDLVKKITSLEDELKRVKDENDLLRKKNDQLETIIKGL